MLCEKQNSCGQATPPLPCAAICVYGGNYYPGVAPSPYCPNLAAQTDCMAKAVAMSCDAWQNGLVGCPACPPVDGAPCAKDLDCAKYDPRYECDLSRPGGYCTAPCKTPDDCSTAGPEICTSASSPSFDPTGALGTMWCELGCGSSNAICRVDEGYTCVNGLCAQPQ
jgi:hypothetical protein